MRKQQTIAQSVSLKGFGFWSGQDVTLEFRPAPVNSGLLFIRTDLPDSPRVPANVIYRINKNRQTSLDHNGTHFDMIEHVMAALAGLQIDNCDICINGAEMPGFDGSSRLFIETLERAGIAIQESNRILRRIKEKKIFQYENSQIEVRPSLTGETRFSYSLHYENPDGSPHPIGHQEFSINLMPDSFRTELMSARTFLLKAEADFLLSRGLCRRVSARDVLVFDQFGPLDNKLLFPNECARHKTLDMIGDFNLAGCDWIGEFHASRTGHLQNALTVTELCKITDPEY